MGENKWTQEQFEAITARDENLLVAAAAGAGKTAVLVERIIQRITDRNNPVDIDRLLVVTFTNAAATEMRERIGDAISKAMEADPGSRLLQRQLVLLGKSSITTIHSFCLEVIRNHFQHIELDPGFRIADETEALLLKMEAMEELFEELYADGGGAGDFYDLLESYGGNRDDLAIQELVLSLYNFVQSDPWPQQWLETHAEMFNLPEGLDFACTPWGRLLVSHAAIELEGCCGIMEKALEAAEKAEGLEPYGSTLRQDISILEKAAELCRKGCKDSEELITGIDGGSWDQLAAMLSSLEFGRFARCGKDADKQQQEIVKSLREDVKKRVKRLAGDVFYAESSEVVGDSRTLYPIIQCLCRLVSEFSARYTAKKRRKQLLDFNDLEHLCLKILTAEEEQPKNTIGDTTGNSMRMPFSPVAMEYRDRFEEILVDEYQDSNLVQEILIRTISRIDAGKPNVFMVGDVKQSIYRFRQAKPELFMEKYNSYASEKGSGYRKIKLFKNFRSRAGVIDGTNYIFRQIMSEAAGELEYSDEEALNPGAVFEQPSSPADSVGGPVEVHIVDTAGIRSEDESDEEAEAAGEAGEETEGGEGDAAGGFREAEEKELPGAVQCEAGIAARRIRELMRPDAEGRQFKVWDKNEKAYRPLEYKDIVILQRSTRNWAGAFLEELTAQGIPAYADTGAGFFKTVEVQIMLSLLQVIDNPRQDIPLLSVLRSPIGGFTQDDLTDLRLADRTGGIYDSLVLLAGQQQPASEKAAAFLARLEQWRDAALIQSTDELIWYLYSDTGFFSYAGAMPGGVQRQANLRLLFERARQFEETSYKGLFHFIRFIDKLKSGKGDMGSAKILGENENVVRIMSIHKSKGLEFPVVILAGCGKSFNLQDMNRSILFHQELGFGPDYVDYRLRLRRPSAAKQALRYKTRTESLSEEMRILYVALTRAREKLIITGSTRNAAKAAQRWCQYAASNEPKLPGFDMLRGKCYFDWILPSLLRHQGCSSLRELLGAEPGPVLFEDPSEWVFRLWNGSETVMQKEVIEDSCNEFLAQLREFDGDKTYSGEWAEIQRRLDWIYPYSKLSAVPAKLSVTELKRRFAAEFLDETSTMSATALPVKRPSFLEETRGLSAAEAGTALHFVMQHIRLEAAMSREYILGQIRDMVERDMLTTRQAEAVDVVKLVRFFQSELGIRMRASTRVSRELPFNLDVAGSEMIAGMAGEDSPEDRVLLQGVIDCCFEEPDGLVLIDYKTDYAPEERRAELTEKYRLQIEYYKRALQQLAGKTVKESHVVLFWSGQTIRY